MILYHFKNLIRILILEKKTLLKGWLVSVLVIFPFTFLPIIFSEEPGYRKYFERIPESIFYAMGFALLIIGAAVYLNYERLQIRMRLFNMTAFTSLKGKWIKEGLGSLTDDLSVALLVHYGGLGYILRIIIDADDLEKQYLQVRPLIDLSLNEQKEVGSYTNKELLIDHYANSFAVKIPIPERKLDDPKYIKKFLSLLHIRLQKFKGKGYTVQA